MNEERERPTSGEDQSAEAETAENHTAEDETPEDETAEFEAAPAPGNAPPSSGAEDVNDWPAADTPAGATSGPPPVEAEAYAPPPRDERDDSATETAAHSVPPAAPGGESTQCPRCGTENRPGVAFCRNCGQRLVAPGVATSVERPSAPEGTRQCPRCGTHNRAGVAFCQNCGANLRVSAAPAAGYVPPSAGQASAGAAPLQAAPRSRGGAFLGPIVLLVAAIGLGTAWWLPFPYGTGSLWERSFGAPGGYGVAFWQGYGAVTGGILDSAYFGFAAAAPILIAIVVLLALAGFLRAAPGGVQMIFLVIALLWAIGLLACFVILEVGGNWNGDIVSVLRVMSPAGIIFLLASLILAIGVLTRLARS